MQLSTLLLPNFINDINRGIVFANETKCSISNVCGPESPLRFGNAFSKEILFQTYIAKYEHV